MPGVILPFNLKLPARPNGALNKDVYDEFLILYDAINGLAEQLAGNELLDWVDYSAQSTIVGWSTFTRKNIQYRYLNYNTIFVLYDLAGTSNNTQSTFSLPVISKDNVATCIAKLSDNSVALSTSGLALVELNTNTVLLYSTLASAAWTASGSKSMMGQFIYRI